MYNNHSPYRQAKLVVLTVLCKQYEDYNLIIDKIGYIHLVSKTRNLIPI